MSDFHILQSLSLSPNVYTNWTSDPVSLFMVLCCSFTGSVQGCFGAMRFFFFHVTDLQVTLNLAYMLIQPILILCCYAYKYASSGYTFKIEV